MHERSYIAQVIGRLSKFWLACLALVLGASAGVAKDEATPAPPTEDEAPIALLIDISSGQVLHSRNADRRFVPASITKVMTTYLAFELIEAGQLDPGQVFTIRPETWREWNGKGSTMWLPADARVTVDELLIGIANVSANDGSIALAEGQAGSVDAWTNAMTAKGREIGMRNSHFGTPNGWPDEGATFTTASDLAILAEAMVRQHPKKFARYVGRQSFTYNGITQTNHDPLIGRVRGADGIKTGFTNESGHGFLGTAQRNGQRLVMVLAGAKRYSERARLSRSYMEWGFANFDRVRAAEKGIEVGSARVQGGQSRWVALVPDRTVFVNRPKGGNEVQTIDYAIEYDGPIRAPILAGQEVATLVMDVPGMAPARVPLFAKEAVEPAGFFARIFNGIAGWFT